MKRFILTVTALTLLLGLCCSAFTVYAEENESAVVSTEGYSREFEGETINVYNWGEYIDESIFADFEELTGIKVNYSNYETNEAMYTKLAAGGASYDIVVPSDYMIERLINEDMLEKIDFSNVPNLKYIDGSLNTEAYDATGEYSVPFTWGFVGVVYNSEFVKDEVTGFADLWNGEYSGKILMMNNSRDVFAIALSRLGYSYNTTDPDHWNEAYELLREQKPLVQSYVTDEIYNKMEGGEAWIAPCYVGDYLWMKDNNPELRFVYPEEGSNTFIDAVCIPKSSKHKEAAEMFINFLCDPNISLRNINEIWYFTPNTETAQMEDYYLNCDVDDEYLLGVLEQQLPQTKGQLFDALPTDSQTHLEELWLLLKTSTVGLHVYIILGGALVFAVAASVYRRIRRKRREASYDEEIL